MSVERVPPLVRLLAAYAMYCLMMAAAHSYEGQSDSRRYIGDVAVLNPEQPGILTSLLFSPFEASRAIVLVQMVVAVSAWSLFALGVHQLAGGGRMGIGLAGAALVYSLTDPVVSWQWVGLSDGLALSLFVGWIGSVMSYLDNPRSRSLSLLMWSCVVLASLARPTLLLVLVPVQLVLLAAGPVRRAANVLTGLAVLAATTLWGSWRLWQLNGIERSRIWYAQNNLADKPAFRDYAAPHIDQCLPLRRALASRDPLAAVRSWGSSDSHRCPDVDRWLSSGEASIWRWIAAEPVDAVTRFGYSTARLRLPLESEQFGALPRSWSEMVLPTSFPVAVLTSLYLVLAVTVVTLSGRAVRRPRGSFVAVVVAGAAGSLTYLFVSWAADGMEVSRHLMPVTTLAPLMALLIPILATAQSAPVPAGSAH
jgi:hypothetical protein